MIFIAQLILSSFPFQVFIYKILANSQHFANILTNY